MARLAVALAQWADLATFVMGVSFVGIGIESNPLMAGAYAVGGLVAVALFKAICVGVVIAAMNRNFRWARLVAGLAIFAGVSASLLNVTAALLY